MSLVADLRLDDDDGALEPRLEEAVVPQPWAELPSSYDPGPMGLATAMLEWTGYAFPLGQWAALTEWLSLGAITEAHN